MKPIEVFYHLFIPNDLRYSAWTWYVNQQLQCIKNSHLHSVANINMAITMPRNWKLSFDNIPFFSNDKTKELTFEEKIREYIQVRFPFVNILDVRDIADTNLFEGHTLGLLYEKCIDLDVNILYFHGKGIVRDSPQVSAWREILNYYCISSWKTCVKMLEHADVVGVKDAKTGNYITSGNFLVD